jgi:uncharacterized protein (UPF0332 family)
MVPGCSVEAVQRSIISRAYYAAFRKAQNFLIVRDGFAVELGESSHNKVIFALKLHPNRYRQMIGEDLRRMKQFRERADYKDEFEGSLEDTVEWVINRAERIINLLERM